MNPFHPAPTGTQSKRDSIAVLSVSVMLLQFCFLPECLARTPRQQSQALGSLSVLGEVFINEAPAPSEATIFPGDVVRTSEHGVATFAASGIGTLKFSPNSSAVFSGASQYLAELQSGTVVVSSLRGPSGLTLRLAQFLLVPAVQDQQTTARVEKAPDSSSSISCLEGSLSVISMEGAAGVLLQANQSVAISATGQLASGAAPPQSETSASPPSTPTSTSGQRKSKKRWVILALAGGGAVAVIGAAESGGHHPISPATP